MGDVSAEPSMEDILSSIKRIIAEEGENAMSRATARRTPAKPVAPMPTPPAYEPPSPSSHDEVLELRDAVPASLEPEAAPEAVRPAPAPAAEPILSPQTAEASRGALDALSKLIVRSDEAPAENTLEALVRELLRPMLRDWLDAKLPGIVETMVAREIARITSQR